MKADHPDANQLAAFVERRLAARERQQILAHLADCADCREVVALTSVPVQQPISVRPIPVWWRMASAVAAIALIVAAGWGLRQTLRPQEKTVSSRMTSIPKHEIAASASPAASEPEMEAKKSKREQRITAAPKRLVAQAKPTTGKPSGTATVSLPSLAAPAPVAQTAEPAIAPFAETPARIVVSAPEQPAEQRATADEISKSAGHFAGLGRFELKTAKAQVSKPGVLWRINALAVERSLEGGKTWETVQVDEGTSFHAVAADGSDIWAGGSRGVLYHSSDAGAHWRQIPVRDGNQDLTGAVVAIRLPQPSEIVLETDSGEQWISRDGGSQWRRL